VGEFWFHADILTVDSIRSPVNKKFNQRIFFSCQKGNNCITFVQGGLRYEGEGDHEAD
jgi:hypothetical protein